MAFPRAEALALAGLPIVESLAQLRDTGRLLPETAGHLAQFSLEMAAENPTDALRLLELAQAVHRETGADAAVTPWLRYAQARANVLAGDLDAAEENLLAARRAWEAQGEALLQARSGLGLTQVLTMQGRFAEAETAILAAIAMLTALPAEDPENRLLRFAARQNLATLLSYQESHREALEVLAGVRAEVDSMLATGVGDDLRL